LGEKRGVGQLYVPARCHSQKFTCGELLSCWAVAEDKKARNAAVVLEYTVCCNVIHAYAYACMRPQGRRSVPHRLKD
jgi:hypothetical protein